ncbi:MAG: hypothetical protein AAFO77_03890 [Pseudomonadota bacterium]
MAKSRCLARGFLTGAFITIASVVAQATEYNLVAIFAKPSAVDAVFADADDATFQVLAGNAELVDALDLQRRFSDPDRWRGELRALMNGDDVSGPEMSTLLLQFVLQSVATTQNTEQTGLPFLELGYAVDYLSAAGHDDLAAYVEAIDRGDFAPSADALPQRLSVANGYAWYPAALSYFSPEDAAKFLKLLPTFEDVADDIDAFVAFEENEAAARAEAAITKAATMQAEDFFKRNPDYLNGRSLKQAIADTVARELDDPYLFAQSAGEFIFYTDVLAQWLTRAVKSGDGVFFAYESF